MVILIQCSDRKGLVAGITTVLADLDINITSMREFVDVSDNRFYVRIGTQEGTDPDALKLKLKTVLPENAKIRIDPKPNKKIVVLVTKEHHCLSDILVRNHFKTLNATVQCVIGNHTVLKDICDRFDIPFFHVPHQDKSKQEFEAEIKAIIDQHGCDFLVLAKFMRILSPEFNEHFPRKIINIHHSFLPAFIGASPYKQAFDRGVKLIGATAHFVTNDLDEGPIIVQKTKRVDHTYAAHDMATAGKEMETATLASALQLVIDNRVLLYGNKTIVFK